MFGRSPVKPSGSELWFIGNFLIIDSISILDFLFFPDSLMEDCMFLEIYPFLLGCPIQCHIIVGSIFL